jgi:hypothetical protein
MPIISDPYNDQRNTLTQSIMRQAIPGFLRQLNPNQFRGQTPGSGFNGGMSDYGGGVDMSQQAQQQRQLAARQQFAARQQSGQPPTNPGMMPGTVLSASSQPPQMNPSLSMPPPQPPQQMMPSSMPPQMQQQQQVLQQQQAPLPGLSRGGLPDYGAGLAGTSAGSKGASAQPPAPAAMKAGM